MSIDGIWTSEILGMFGWESVGIIEFDRGKAVGGGNNHYFTGTYEKDGDHININHLLQMIPYEDLTPEPIR